MRRALAALAAAFALMTAAGAPATTITGAPRHDPGKGCAALRQLIANLNAGRLEDEETFPGPTFYSDALGEVEVEEEEAFVHAMRHSEGKPDRGPIRLSRVFSLHRDKYEPIYLVVLEREAWHETRLETDSMEDLIEIPDPHYQVDRSYWLVKFQSNDVSDFREVPEMYDATDESRELKRCRQD